MRKIALIFCILFIPTISYAAPLIGDVQGTFNHGKYITITGAGFGTKSPAKPIMWAPFENGSVDLDHSLSSGASPLRSNVSDNLELSSADLPHARSSAAIRGIPFVASPWTKRAIILGVNTTTPTRYVYIFNRRKYAHPTFIDGVSNYKFNRLWGEVDDVSDFFLHFTNYSGKRTNSTTEGTTSSTSFTMGYVHQNNVWFTEELENFHGDPLVLNARWNYWVNGNQYSRTNYLGNKTGTTSKGPVQTEWYRWYVQNHWTIDPPPSGAYVYFDDLYMDVTFARVMIGNASTFAACTHREPLIPTAWSTGSITAYFNQGSFANGQSVYLFVVDSTGAPSPGKLITIGGVSAISDPLPVSPSIPNPPFKINVN